LTYFLTRKIKKPPAVWADGHLPPGDNPGGFCYLSRATAAFLAVFPRKIWTFTDRMVARFVEAITQNLDLNLDLTRLSVFHT
jgi:hypothetical protein